MRPRPGSSPQARGRAFEKFFARLLGVEPQKGSGNLWYAKLDVADGSITWSLKYTENESISISKKMLREAEEGVYKNGDNSIPGIAAAIDGGNDVIVVLKWADFARLLAHEQSGYIVPSKAAQKRHLAGIPVILREPD